MFLNGVLGVDVTKYAVRKVNSVVLVRVITLPPDVVENNVKDLKNNKAVKPLAQVGRSVLQKFFICLLKITVPPHITTF